MSRFHAPQRLRTLSLSVGTICILLAGCSYALTVDPDYHQNLDYLTFRVDRPLARQLRYTYQTRTDLGGEEGTPIGSADATTAALLRRGESLPLVSVAPANGGDWGAHYGRLAEDARDRGDTEGALMYRELAVAQAETQAAMNQVTAAGHMLATYQSVVSALAAVGQAMHDSDAASVADWVADETGAVGPTAPEGSLLHLDFLHVTHGDRFNTSDARVELFVTALLDDGRGNVYRSDRNAHVFIYKEGKPPEYVPADVVPVAMRLDDPALSGPLEGVPENLYLRMQAILARSAIANLNDQIGRTGSAGAAGSE